MFVFAWRSVWRNRSRSIGAAFAVAFTVWMSMAYFALSNAARDGMYVNLTSTVGHIQIHIRDYRSARDFREAVIPRAAALRERLARVLGDGLIVEALEVPALLSGGDRARGALLVGLRQPPTLRQRFAGRFVQQGRLPGPDDVEGIALGRALARTLQVGIGDVVYAYAPSTDGTGASAFVVVGILHFPDPLQDARGAVLSLPAAQDLAAPDAVTRFEIHIPEFRRTTDDAAIVPLAARLQEALGDEVVVETWRETYPAISSLERALRPILTVFLGLFFILAGLLVLNTVYLSVVERTREFGVIVALGANRRRVLGMVLLESLLLCGSGAAAGLLLGSATVARLARGFSYPGTWQEVVEAYGLPVVMYGSIAPIEVAIIAAFAVGIGVCAALLPAWTAGRLEPVEAMRFVA
ncbi:MAG: FtsX-like permease family protein [Armatimonadota bacterium]|nr:FtsX-like permease family protein [Armatimonadota bacterium]MDR7548294.1 FtsX-like permease family protein [Armatimonadota bacterium]